MMDNNPSVYEQVGEDGFRRLAAAFYRRVAADPILSVVYPQQNLASAERYLYLFLVQYWGGPTHYAQERGHPRLRLRHQPFRIGEAERDAWVAAMLAAMEETEVPEPAFTTMRNYFENAATFLSSNST
ncbi:MAG: globin domain-containing protein [Aggregatilineales bacterium]